MTTKRTSKTAPAATRKTRAVREKRPADPSSGNRLSSSVLFEILEETDRTDVLLGFLVHDLARMRRRANFHFLKSFGLTRAQWWVLASLSRHDGMTQTALADLLETGKANLGVVIEGLESSGWVERHGLPSDMRAKRVFLTRSAVTLIKRMFQSEVEFNNLTLADLSRKERDTLFKLLGKLKTGVARLDTSPGSRED